MSVRRSLTRVTLRAIPLTPIHVGDGQPVRLDEYLIKEPETPPDDDLADAPAEAAAAAPMLCRFDQHRALLALGGKRGATFRTYLDQGNLGEAATLLRQAGRDHVLERIALSRQSHGELRKAIGDPHARGGQVNLFVRSGGRPFIPGSTIKGAFRTALASARLPAGVQPTGLTHERAMREALGIDQADTATDPLRFLSIDDAALPDGSTRIDRAVILKRDGSVTEMQMHYERLRARSDGPSDRTGFSFSVSLDSRFSALPGSGLGELLKTVSRFHWDIWRTERDLFFAGQPKTIAAMDRVLKGRKTADGRGLHETGPIAPNYLLLRLGRFGHFESKSLARVRQGHLPQAKNPADRTRAPDAWGSTRTVTRTDDGVPIPFGWLLAWIEKEESL